MNLPAGPSRWHNATLCPALPTVQSRTTSCAAIASPSITSSTRTGICMVHFQLCLSDMHEDALAVEYPHQPEPEQHIRQSKQKRGILCTKPPSGPRRIAANVHPGAQWHTRTIRLGKTPPGHEPIQHNG